MKKAEFIKEIIEGYSWSPGEKLEFSKEALRLLLIIVLNEAKNLEDVGGTGKISGIVIGVFLLQIIFVGLNFLSVDANMLYVIKGLIILVACAIDMRKYLARK